MRFGNFDDKAKEYVIEKPNTPHSWGNYLGSTEHGAIITNNAGGYSFFPPGILADQRQKGILDVTLFVTIITMFVGIFMCVLTVFIVRLITLEGRFESLREKFTVETTTWRRELNNAKGEILQLHQQVAYMQKLREGSRRQNKVQDVKKEIRAKHMTLLRLELKSQY